MIKKIILFILFGFFNTSFSQLVSGDYQKAMEAYHVGDFTKAISLFQNLTNAEKNDKEIISTAEFFIAESYLGLDKDIGAAGKFGDFINKYPMSNFRDLALYRLGTIYYNCGDYQNSRDNFLVLLNEYPNSEYAGSSYYFVGQSYSHENKFEEAELYFKDAISSDNNSFAAHTIYALANLYEKTNKYSDAVAHYDELLTYHSKSELAPYAQMRIGICYFKLKEYDSVVLELSDPLINELPVKLQTESKIVLANSFFRLMDYKNASETYTNILSSYPDDIQLNEIKYGLAWVNFQMLEYNEAFRIFSGLASGSDSLAINSLFWSAESKRYLGENDSALKIYEKFLENFPDNKLAPKAKFNSGIIYYGRNENGNAERNLISAVDSHDDLTKAKAFTLLGEISLNKKDFASAINYFNSAVNIRNLPEDVNNRALLGLGIAGYYTNDFENAIEILSRLNSRYPNFEKEKVNFYLAESFFAKGEFSKSLTHFSRVSFSEPDLGHKALYGKAYSYFNLKDYANALFYFEDYTKRYKNSDLTLDAKLRMAECYYGTKNFDKASGIYKDIFSQTRTIKDDFTYYQYCQSLFKAGKSSEAIDEFKNLQNKFPRSKFTDDSQYLIGWIYFQQGNFEDAIINYKLIFKKYPASAVKPIAYYSIGDSYYNLGQYDSALVYYNHIISKYPNTQYVFDAINGIQYCYVAKDQPDNAISVIDIYISNNPNAKNADQVLLKKGEIYYSLESYAKAIQGYTELINLYPNSSLIPNAYYWIGKSSQMLGQTDDAVNSFKYVIKNYLNSEIGVGAVLELGKIYEENNELKNAVDLYSGTINSMPDSKRVPELLFYKGMALKRNGEIQIAYETFDEVVTYYVQTIFAAKAKLELALLEIERKDYTNAGILLRELGENRNDDIGAQAQYFYGVSLFEQGKTTEAISALVRVRSVFSGYDEWYSKSLLKLGDCYVKLNDKNNAKDMYRAVIKRHKNDELGKEANQKLGKL